MKRTILCLARDAGAGNVLGPTAKALRERGHHVRMVAEEGGVAATRLAQPLETMNRAQLEQLLRSWRPHLVVTGLSSPRYLETWLDEWARADGVPLVHIEDYWGAHKRSPVAADLVVTVDEVSKRLVQYARPGSRVVVAGFAGIAPLDALSMKSALLFTWTRHEGWHTLVYPDGGPECELALPMLVQSILLSKMPIMLFPRFHPKFAKVSHPSGVGSWDDWCKEQLRPLGENVWYLPQCTTDELCERADGVVSGYSSTMFRAAVQGKLALTLWNEAIERNLLAETGLSKTPLMLAGEYPVLSSAESLDHLLGRDWPRYPLQAFDAGCAAEAIAALLG